MPNDLKINLASRGSNSHRKYHRYRNSVCSVIEFRYEVTLGSSTEFLVIHGITTSDRFKMGGGRIEGGKT